MRIKRCLKIIVFCSIFLILFNRIYTILSWKDTAGDYYSSVDSYYELEEDVVDVLFFGSSHCYCSVDPSVLWDREGIASFNLAISGQDFAGTYYTIKEALKTQSPKLICMDLFYANRTGYEAEGNLYRNTLPFKISQNSYEMVNSLVREEERKKEFWFRWPILHTRYKELQEGDFRENTPVYLGYHAGFDVKNVAALKPYTGDEILELPEERKEWLLKIINLVQQNDIELCFFIAPYVATEEDQKLWNCVKKLSEENNIPVLDMIELNEELKLDVDADFCDWQHTNHYGAQKVSKYLGNYIAKNYDFIDHRGEERYALWNENSKVRAHEVCNHKLKNISDIWNYLDTISCLDDYVVVLSTTGDYQATDNDISEYLINLGVGTEFYDKTGIWVFDNGELIYKTNEDNALEHFDLQTTDLVVGRADGVNSIVLDKQQYYKVTNGITILVYDKVLGTVADCIGFDANSSYGAVR